LQGRPLKGRPLKELKRKMKKFELLEHKADLKIRVFGRDLTGLFINAALAVAEQQNPAIGKSVKEWESVEINSSDLNSLLVDWLNEILSRSDLNQKVYTDFQIEKLSKNYLKAMMAGQKIDRKQLEIKAATYHQIEIKRAGSRWQATIIFDI
jgi:SHS2 domain-containing protein